MAATLVLCLGVMSFWESRSPCRCAYSRITLGRNGASFLVMERWEFPSETACGP